MNDIPVRTLGDLTLTNAASTAVSVGQSTSIEQSRAVAEIQAAIVVAQKFPRDERHSWGRIQATASRLSLAKEAFFSFPRGKETIHGASIKLARELARCWGNIQYEIVELSQDVQNGESEVMAYAWDLESNVRAAMRFIIKHERHTRSGVTRLRDPRDIYELIANNGSRRLRQCIFAVIPSDVVAEAEAICRRTLEKGDGKPLGERIAGCVTAFGKLGVTRTMLAKRLGKDPEKMSINDLTDMEIIYRSIREGEPKESFFESENELAAPAPNATQVTESKSDTPTDSKRTKYNPAIHQVGPQGLPILDDNLNFVPIQQQQEKPKRNKPPGETKANPVTPKDEIPHGTLPMTDTIPTDIDCF